MFMIRRNVYKSTSISLLSAVYDRSKLENMASNEHMYRGTGSSKMQKIVCSLMPAPLCASVRSPVTRGVTNLGSRLLLPYLSEAEKASPNNLQPSTFFSRPQWFRWPSSRSGQSFQSANKTIHVAWLKGTSREDLGQFKRDTIIESQTGAPVWDAANSHHNLGTGHEVLPIAQDQEPLLVFKPSRFISTFRRRVRPAHQAERWRKVTARIEGHTRC